MNGELSQSGLSVAVNDDLVHSKFVDFIAEIAQDLDGSSEQLAEDKLIQKLRQAESLQLPTQQDAMGMFVNLFDCPSFCCDKFGRVLYTSAETIDGLDVGIGTDIDDLGLSSLDGHDISEYTRSILKNDTLFSLSLRQYTINDTDAVVSIAAVPFRNSNGELRVLFWFLKSALDVNLKEYFISQFRLTKAEGEVLESFASGLSLKQIAERRDRSLATIRAQYYSLQEKTHATSQTELMRVIYQTLMAVQTVNPAILRVSYPHRKQYNLLRSHGRALDVTRSGDPDGKLVIRLGTLGHWLQPRSHETVMYERGVNLISIAPPGFGQTDPVPVGQSFYECLAKDVEAVLDQLQVDDCILETGCIATRDAVAVAKRIPHRVSMLVLSTTILPRIHNRPDRQVRNALHIMNNISLVSQRLNALVFKLYSLCVSLGGWRVLMKVAQTQNLPLTSYVEQPEVRRAWDENFSQVMMQGYSGFSDQLMRVKQDYWPELKDLACPIFIAETVASSASDPEDIKTFFGHYGADFELHLLETMGNYPPIQDIECYLDFLEKCEAKIEARSALQSVSRSGFLK